MAYRIKDWKKFQHFKDRRPPWIKLYRDILEDPEWYQLDAKAAKVLVMLWLIASEAVDKSGTLPDDKRLAFRLRIDEKTLKSTMSQLCHWIDIIPSSERYQDDTPETETETETEGETEESLHMSEPASRVADLCPPCPIQKIVEVYNQELPTLTKCVVMNKSREGYIRQRWRECFEDGDFKTVDEGIAKFRLYFQHVGRSDFLCGRVRANGDRKPFVADLEWLTRPTNWAKVIEGRYHQNGGANGVRTH